MVKQNLFPKFLRYFCLQPNFKTLRISYNFNRWHVKFPRVKDFLTLKMPKT